ncbi:DUF5681 domain-containing protein [uncultured Aliiroseovarius sp.]
MSDQNDKSPVGYMCPPEHARFKKGKSGNPKGRPKRRMTSTRCCSGC